MTQHTHQQITMEALRLFRVVHEGATTVEFFKNPNMPDYRKLAVHVLSRVEPKHAGNGRHEISLKSWLMAQANRLGITYGGAFMRYQRGSLRPKNIRKVNARVIWVT